MQLKVGEWYLHGTDVVQVKSKDEWGYSLSTGIINIGTRGESVYPLTLQNKAVADSVESYEREMRGLCRGVNWPDIASYIETALHNASGNEAKQREVLEVVQGMRNKLVELQRMTFDNGIKVFR